MHSQGSLWGIISDIIQDGISQWHEPDTCRGVPVPGQRRRHSQPGESCAGRGRDQCFALAGKSIFFPRLASFIMAIMWNTGSMAANWSSGCAELNPKLFSATDGGKSHKLSPEHWLLRDKRTRETLCSAAVTVCSCSAVIVSELKLGSQTEWRVCQHRGSDPGPNRRGGRKTSQSAGRVMSCHALAGESWKRTTA